MYLRNPLLWESSKRKGIKFAVSSNPSISPILDVVSSVEALKLLETVAHLFRYEV